MASSDVTLPQDGRQGNVKVHPYLISFVRWCVSCIWSTATVVLHRLVTSPLPQITAREQPKLTKPRQASTDHLHPEPKVECVVLHTPPLPTLDVIFVHGLYGSLGNTWRQGDWRTKHKLDPTKILLRNHPTQCHCTQKQDQMKHHTNETYTSHKQMKYDSNETYNYETDLNETKLNENMFYDSCFQKIFPNDNNLITEQFYNNNLLEINVNNYETQAKFVTELFKNDCNKNNNLTIHNIDTFKCNFEQNKCECVVNETCVCDNDTDEGRSCDVGCGCVCDDCYSYCWPKDWIKEDFPGARVISINYTSDPYLWRPLWVKGNKRLHLHERAEQMMEQLLSLGVGQRPIIWVGHSKGGLFIKQIYCEAYEAYLKLNDETKKYQNTNLSNKSDNINNIDNNTYNNSLKDNINLDNNNIQNQTGNIKINEPNSLKNEHNFNIHLKRYNNFDKISNNFNGFEVLNGCGENYKLLLDNKKVFFDIFNGNDDNNEMNDMNETKFVVSSFAQEDTTSVSLRASLWSASAGFMFYSVPHRGSPLADIKTPITARSVELTEIAKDCSLVLELQDRWLEASRRSRPQVRSLVETCRTLMSVLWLRIVSVDSADAGIGSLHGVSVDHREICKPSSRKCLLYTELTDLIAKALNKCSCS